MFCIVKEWSEVNSRESREVRLLANFNLSFPPLLSRVSLRMSPPVQYGSDEVGALVLDIGSGSVRAG